LVRPTTEELTVDAALARRIGTRSGTKWFRLQGPRAWRARRDAPFCWSEHYLRGDLSPDTLKNPFDIENVKSGVIQTISAALLDERIATALGAEAGSAALVITRRHRDARGRLVSVGIHTHPADRYEIETTLLT
jgi:GntR family transcriptional regulator